MTAHPQDPSLKVVLRLVEECDLATELFHRLNRILPESQEVATVSSTCTVREAMEKMADGGFSQLPVVADGKVIGVFSYRRFAQFIARQQADTIDGLGCAPGDLPVEQCMDRFAFAGVTDEMTTVIDALGRDGAVLVGTPENLHGVLTSIDLVRYLHRVAGPFVLVLEIEMCLRALLERYLGADRIAIAAVEVLSKQYAGKPERIPTNLDDMNFGHYRNIVTNPGYWPEFEGVLRGNRIAVGAKLKMVNDIRNDLFHFRRKTLKVSEYQELAMHRDWLLACTARMGTSAQTAGGE
jgi:predicted transcriptional regulator